MLGGAPWENRRVADRRIGVVLRALDAVGRRDVQAVLDEVDPDVELHPFVSVWQRRYEGRAGIEQWLRDIGELWEGYTVAAHDFRDLGADTLLVLGQWRGRGKGAATPLDGPLALLVAFRAGKVASVDVHLDEASALKAFEAPSRWS
jgi:ketosteroid isomerase-like protein